ncbi:WxL domain-containing protein [Candidatus Enterococcus murrayae]|uniref:WxL domain-containing protein n=1 Tax=Candidatus Enterococcus murrayae TaxID=2815321 RepID=A0ABS3HGE4_9ENTE|nr:WxL domain-containing protein [Enterococcus sp. MJM16]MBO0452024.1 WxL domain-containing protein [Enterococcus sp. MJM16]
MRSLIRKLFVVVFVLSGLIIGSLGFPDHSLAYRGEAIQSEINFDMYMDDGSLIPAGKVPVAKADYEYRTSLHIYVQPGYTYTPVYDNTINQKTVTIPYDGAGNFSATGAAGSYFYGIRTPSDPFTSKKDAVFFAHIFRNLNFSNAPAYIRSISAKSSVVGDYSYYKTLGTYYKLPDFTINDSSNYHHQATQNVAIPNPDLTRMGPGSFKYEGSQVDLMLNPNGVEFAYVGGWGRYTNIPSDPLLGNFDFLHTYSSLATNGKRITFFMKEFQVVENFEDESGAPLTPPTGFTQGKKTDADADQYKHTMNKLPTSYTSGGNMYVLEGWYQGDTKPGTLEQSNPPSMTVDYTQPKSISDLDTEGKIHVVYKKSFAVNEKYIDGSNNSINGGAWDVANPAAANSNFTGNPAASKTDSGNAIWEYQGWKEGISGAVNSAGVPVKINNITESKDIYYVYRKKVHTITQKFVDSADGTTLIQMSSNPNSLGKLDNDTYTATVLQTITDTSGDLWDYAGWENVTDAPGTVHPKSTPIAINNIKGPKEVRFHYQARSTTASLDLTPTPQIVANNGSVAWSSRLTNTGTSALNNLTLKATSNWASGLSTPTQVTVTPAGGAPQNFTISPADWVGGFNLTGISIPSAGPNNYADITFTDTAAGAVNQVLPAEIEIDGNIATPLTAENFVRIDDPDEPNLKPTGNAGLINIPNFKFGEVEVKPSAQKKGLDVSAYRPGYNPYIRFMDNESNFGWDLTVKLSQFTSGTKTLPTTTAINLRNGTLLEVQNYNKHNESYSFEKLEGTKNIPSDGTTVSLTSDIARGVHELSYDINNDVELELMAHSGIAGLNYEAEMDWTLTTSI